MGAGSIGGSVQRALGQDGFTHLVRYAYDQGITYIDTADSYKTHQMVREAIKGLPREKLFIQTKMPGGVKDPAEAIDLAMYFPEKVAELDSLIEEHLLETNALLPIANKNFKGNPRKPRTQLAKAPNMPRSLRLEETELQTSKAGSKSLQLLDENGKPRKTHALVVEGTDWVSVDNQLDGSVTVKWKTPSGNGKAKVLFGWKGGATVWETNDWTRPPVELMIKAN